MGIIGYSGNVYSNKSLHYLCIYQYNQGMKKWKIQIEKLDSQNIDPDSIPIGIIIMLI